MHILNHKLKAAARRLRSWSKGLFSNHKQQLIITLDVILQIDTTQDSRALSAAEALIGLC